MIVIKVDNVDIARANIEKGCLDYVLIQYNGLVFAVPKYLLWVYKGLYDVNELL